MSYRNIVLVGAAGNIGQSILNALVASPTNLEITLLVREESKSIIPQASMPTITILKGDLNDPHFLKGTLTGQDVLIIALNSTPANFELQNKLIDIAANLGVKRIIPSDFGSDVTNNNIVKAVPPYQAKLDATKYLERVVFDHPGTSWTAVINGPFYDWCLERNLYGFNPKARTAVLYDNGVGKFDTTRLVTVGQVVAKIITQPEEFRNSHVYISEFTVSQNDIFDVLLRITRTRQEDWVIEHRTAESLRQQGLEKLENNDFGGVYDLIFAALHQPGLGSDFSATRKLDNHHLGLERGNLFEVTRDVVEMM
ncbi:hypothetical protein BGW36DRAFT_320529 [Talaromyces proteolyticus]|uniref:NmrA-like domain-containing protein n=1 Tax=Talaromyces proteolyticus TaxID=1131652 RepID=A0AAD4KQD8_9EURO|nr:uncharacterized protein BGW36DRAFT_320529 [Talaromyces proteolyticus]KAH8697958.1 hypothetical protein BGW36DRAFT_320529 [Talaromyces proteolyticus]